MSSDRVSSRGTFQRHYKSINVRPNKKNLLSYQQRRQVATPDFDTSHTSATRYVHKFSFNAKSFNTNFLHNFLHFWCIFNTKKKTFLTHILVHI